MFNKTAIVSVIYILLAIPIFGKTGYSTKDDIRKFYQIKRNTKGSESNYELWLERLVEYYSESKGDSKFSLKVRLKNNAAELEKQSVDYAVHSLAAFQLMMDKNERLTLVSMTHKMEGLLNRLKDKRLISDIQKAIGLYYYFVGMHSEARKYYNKSLKLAKQIGDTIQLQKLYFDIGASYFSEEKYKISEKYLEKANAFERYGYMKDHYNRMVYLAAIKDVLGYTDEALRICKRLEPDVPEKYKGTYYNNLGQTYMVTGDLENAISSFLRSQSYMEKEESFALETVYINLSECYRDMGDMQNALIYLNKRDSIVDLQEKAASFSELERLKKEDEKKLRALEKKNGKAQFSAEKTKSNRLTFLLILSVLFVLITIGFVLNLRQKNRTLVRMNMESIVHSKEIEEAVNGEFTAKRILPELIEKFEHLLHKKELFKDPDLSVARLSKKMGTNPKDLSQTINGHYGVPFRTLINQKRVDMAKYMLMDQKYKNYSMQGIAQSVGYSNKSTFYKQFKELTGLTPLYFQEMALKIKNNSEDKSPEEEKHPVIESIDLKNE